MSHTYAGRAERKKHTHTQQEGTWTRAAVAGRVGAGVGHGDGDGDGGRELAGKGPNKLSDTHRTDVQQHEGNKDGELTQLRQRLTAYVLFGTCLWSSENMMTFPPGRVKWLAKVTSIVGQFMRGTWCV